jgi:hypothetical protein
MFSTTLSSLPSRRVLPSGYGGRLQAARNDELGGRLLQSRKKTLIEIEAYTVPKPDLAQAVLRIVRITAGHLGLSASNINQSDFVVHDRLTGPVYREVRPSDRNLYERGRCNRGHSVGPGVYRQSHGWGVDYGQKL